MSLVHLWLPIILLWVPLLLFTIARCNASTLMWLANGLSNPLTDILSSIDTDHDQGGYPVLPEASLTAMEIIDMYGYRGEAHDVITPDGYVLQIHRLRSSKYKDSYDHWSIEGNFINHSDPVLIQHGILTSSASWLCNGKRDSLPFVLADEGHDVWLSNLRGNRYGSRHLRMSDEDDSFWKFTIDDHALLDLPRVIDYILEVTTYPKLSIIAHSMGTTVTMLMLAAKPEYNQKMSLVILQAPVMYGRYLKNPLRVAVNHIEEVKKITAKLGKQKILPASAFSRGLFITACTEHPLTLLCEASIHAIGGYDHELLDRARMHVFLSHYDTSSWPVAFHYAQILTTPVKSMPKRYDLGPSYNSAKYGQLEPPSYNLSQITAPLAMFYGYMDLYVDFKDLQRLRSQLQNVVVFEEVPYDLWAHQDFVIAKDATKHHYRRLLQVLQSEGTPQTSKTSLSIGI